jgi:hypothetical protein
MIEIRQADVVFLDAIFDSVKVVFNYGFISVLYINTYKHSLANRGTWQGNCFFFEMT